MVRMQLKDSSPVCLIVLVFVHPVEKRCLWLGRQTVTVRLRFVREFP